ncbi:isopentenyl-diphosphate Delta-isomerase [Agromyces seonyuensis]|uniref:Isopentenyl-diphosphate Delta-isomerase n=1 Tax=Agromyces seonyuensis TaxID=2662446 RepID=A0A6I4NVF7_9MICO|nr:isopentenyl-diphosphate Delta-isomerase [Agromyces seonyuensis]MWB98233.1 isopentenyl-diphosphate Delta-isomerase [Agromyces seonyuensis]
MHELHDDGADQVVLLDADGEPIGVARKSEIHGAETPLHLAFSCHVLDDEGRVLVTRRSLEKQAWPGVWTNSFCGHPRPAEPIPAAVRRHADHELGLVLTGLELAVPLFRYRAVDAAGIVEHEVCPVYLARAAGPVVPNPAEVVEHVWADPVQLGEAIRRTPWAFSPWLVLQAELLPFLGGTGRRVDPTAARLEAVSA